MTHNDRVNMEKDMERVFDKLIADKNFGGRYYSLTPGNKHFIDDQQYQALIKAHLMFKDMSKDRFLLDAGISQDWP